MSDQQKQSMTPASMPPAETPPKRRIRFMGSFLHSLDSKGRLVIPQGFRDKLGATFCVAPSFDFRSIALYPNEIWEKRNETYESLDPLNPALSEYLEQFYALSYDEQSCDAQGRVLLPAGIRTKILGEQRDVEITGANDHVRVVGSESATGYWKDFLDRVPSLLETISTLEKQSR